MQPDPTPDLDELERLERLDRCDWCGWPIGPREQGCAADSCSQRPLPYIPSDYLRKRQILRATIRAARERDELRDELRRTRHEVGKLEDVMVQWMQAARTERARAERAEARLRELEADVCSVCMGTGLPGGCTSAACQCGDGSRTGELTAPYRARAERAEADLAESKRLVEKAEARAKELEAARDPLARLWPDGEGNWLCKIGPVRREELPDGSDLPMRRAVQLAFHALIGRWPEATFSGWGEPWTDGERRVARPQKEPR